MNPLGMDPVVLGERLKLARSRSSRTQEVAARELKLARTTLIAIEQGERRLQREELNAMVTLYGTSINELARSSVVRVELMPRFRALSGAPNDAALGAARLLGDLATAECELEQLLNQPLRRNYPAERALFPGDIREQAETASLELRHRLGLGLGPISDIVSLLELEMGVRIFVRPLADSKISGLFAFDETVGACILLNAHHPRERRAMTASHELGHLISARDRPDVLFLDSPAQAREEKFATAFGVAFLMPATTTRSRFAELVREAGRFSPRHLIILAHVNNVSYEAMCRRMEELSLLPEGTWESLKERGFSGSLASEVLGDGGRATEKQIIPPRLWLLASEAHEKGLLTEGQLSELLHVDRVDVRRILDLGTADNDLQPQTSAS